MDFSLPRLHESAGFGRVGGELEPGGVSACRVGVSRYWGQRRRGGGGGGQRRRQGHAADDEARAHRRRCQGAVLPDACLQRAAQPVRGGVPVVGSRRPGGNAGGKIMRQHQDLVKTR